MGLELRDESRTRGRCRLLKLLSWERDRKFVRDCDLHSCCSTNRCGCDGRAVGDNRSGNADWADHLVCVCCAFLFLPGMCCPPCCT